MGRLLGIQAKTKMSNTLTKSSLQAFLLEKVPSLETGEYSLDFKLNGTMDMDEFDFRDFLDDIRDQLRHDPRIGKLSFTFVYLHHRIYINLERCYPDPPAESEEIIGKSDLWITKHF